MGARRKKDSGYRCGNAVPQKPGSPAAVALGCCCPVEANNGGLGRADDVATWWTYDTDCPVHFPRKAKVL